MRAYILASVVALLSTQASLAEPISLFGINMTMSNTEIREELESRDFTCVDGEKISIGLKRLSVFSCSRENTEGASPSIALYDEQHKSNIFLLQSQVPAYFGERHVSIDCEVANLCQLPLSEAQASLKEHTESVGSFDRPEGAGNLNIACASGRQGELLCTPWLNQEPHIWLFEGSLGLPPTSPTFD